MVALVIFLSVVAITVLVNRIATRALMLTGLSEEVARFQSRSALTGTGFATRESEHIMAYPARRRIVTLLMLLGNAGLVTAVSTFVLSFVGTGTAEELLERSLLLLGGLTVLVAVARSERIDQLLTPIIERALAHYTELDVKDYYALLHLEGDYTVGKVEVQDGSWLAGHSIRELELSKEGVLVLSLDVAGEVMECAPHSQHEIHPGDALILYGEQRVVAELGQRPAGPDGDKAHEEACRMHEEKLREQEARERVRADDAVDTTAR